MMKRNNTVATIVTIIAIIAITIPVTAQPPTEKHAVIRTACYAIALDILTEDPQTPMHCERLWLAHRLIKTAPRMTWPLKIAEIAEGAHWSSPITWETVTDAQVRTAIEGVWNDVAAVECAANPECYL